MHSKSLQSCVTLCNSRDCSLPGSSAHGILQPRILEGVSIINNNKDTNWGGNENNSPQLSWKCDLATSSKMKAKTKDYTRILRPSSQICFSWRYRLAILKLTYVYSRTEFCNKQFMIWATVSSQSGFCWAYRASPSLAAKNIINLILVWIIWWCPCVESSLVLLEECVCCDPWVLLAKVFQPLPCFILYSKAKFACYSRYLLTFYFGIPVPCDEKLIFWRCYF